MPRTTDLSAIQHPTLDDLLAYLNGGRHERFFLKRPRVAEDGSIETLTRKGARLYGRLTTLLYACARTTGMEVYNGGDTVNDIVEGLDEISEEET